mgnify:CR=1 FL=1
MWVKMDIFDKEKYKKKLYYYYLNNYGKRDTDVWYASPAVNVWVFGRDDKIITISEGVNESLKKAYPNNKQKIYAKITMLIMYSLFFMIYQSSFK